jgi:hypothetical protein
MVLIHGCEPIKPHFRSQESSGLGKESFSALRAGNGFPYENTKNRVEHSEQRQPLNPPFIQVAIPSVILPCSQSHPK